VPSTVDERKVLAGEMDQQPDTGTWDNVHVEMTIDDLTPSLLYCTLATHPPMLFEAASQLFFCRGVDVYYY